MALTLDAAIQQFLDHVKVERELAPATVAAYGSDLADFARFIDEENGKYAKIVKDAHIQAQ